MRATGMASEGDVLCSAYFTLRWRLLFRKRRAAELKWP